MTTTDVATKEVTPNHHLEAPAAWDGCLMDPPWKLQGGEKHYETLSIAQLAELRPALDALFAKEPCGYDKTPGFRAFLLD